MNKLIKVTFLALLIFISAYLRFYNLGYSDYIPDETTVLYPIKHNSLNLNYLSEQRKGPMQWVISYLTNIFVHDVYNTFWMRFPFALFNLLAVVLFFKFVFEDSKSFYIALVSSTFLSVNGLIVAFSRIVQYQNLNLFFSFASLYFYAKYKNTSKTKFSLFGSILFSLSLLSHWDALFIIPYIVFVHYKVKNIKSVLLSLIVMLCVTSIYTLPFVLHLISSTEDLTYFSTRVGLSSSLANLVSDQIISRISLYNPFYFLNFIFVICILAFLFFRSTSKYISWLFINFFLFITLIKNPGTHIYNLLIPFFVLTGYVFVNIFSLIKKYLKFISILVAGAYLIVISFFTFQTYKLFVDNDIEYPWEREMIFKYQTKEYTQQSLTNNIIGFPYNRGWNKIREFILSDVSSQGYTYITNDNKSISNFYLNMDYGLSEKMYAIGVKTPYTFVTDYKFSQLKNKHTIKMIENSKQETLARIYEVNSEKYNN